MARKISYGKPCYQTYQNTQSCLKSGLVFDANFEHPTCLDFLIIAFCVFLLVRLIMKLSRKKKEEPKPAAPVEPSEEVKLLREIRDALKKG